MTLVLLLILLYVFDIFAFIETGQIQIDRKRSVGGSRKVIVSELAK